MASKVQIPKGWRSVRLGDVATEVNDRANGESDAEVYSVTKYDGFVRSLDYFDRQVFSRDTKNYKIVRKGDFAYATIHLDEGSLGMLLDADAALISPMYTVFRLDAQVADPEFLFPLMKLPNMVNRYKRIGEGSIHRRKSISFERLSSLPILLPPLPEQRAIAAVLDSIDDAIERTEAVIAATEQLRDSLLHELLTRGVPGWHTEWKEAPGIGTIPVSWEVVRLGEVCGSPEYGAGAPATNYNPSLPRYVRITDLTDNGRLRDEDARSANPSQVVGYELEPGDLLFARSGATVGKTYMYRLEDGPCVYAGYLIRFRATPDLAVPNFLRWFTHSRPYASWVASMFRAGAQPNINGKEYASMSVPLPPMAEQQAIATMLDGVDRAIEQWREERDILTSLKTSAADALFTGRVRVGAR